MSRQEELTQPSLAVSAISSTYWGREEDLDIEYSLVFQQNVINPNLTHLASHVWWDVVGNVCHISGEIFGEQTCVV